MKRITALLLSLLFYVAITACERIEREEISDAPQLLQQEPDSIETELFAEPKPELESESFEPALDLNDIINPDVIYSGGAYLYNVTKDAVVFSKNENMSFPPASILKIMTCLITLENIDDFSQIVEVPFDCFDEFYQDNPNFDGIADAQITILQDNLTYLDCLYGLMTASGCEVSNVLAYNVTGGDMLVFVDLMNIKAGELGCIDTNFTNAHGLYETENYTSARDMFLITRYAYENYPLFKEIYEQERYEMPPNFYYPDGYFLTNHNSLTIPDNYYYIPYASGIKTGSIDYFYEYIDGEWQILSEGVTSLVSSAEINGDFYILVTIAAPYYFGPYTDEAGNRLRGMHYTYADHMFLYQTVFDMTSGGE